MMKHFLILSVEHPYFDIVFGKHLSCVMVRRGKGLFIGYVILWVKSINNNNTLAQV